MPKLHTKIGIIQKSRPCTPTAASMLGIRTEVPSQVLEPLCTPKRYPNPIWHRVPIIAGTAYPGMHTRMQYLPTSHRTISDGGSPDDQSYKIIYGGDMQTLFFNIQLHIFFVSLWGTLPPRSPHGVSPCEYWKCIDCSAFLLSLPFDTNLSLRWFTITLNSTPPHIHIPHPYEVPPSEGGYS